MAPALFDDTAQDFAAATDSQIQRDSYIRGQRFLHALQGTVPVGGRVLDYGCGPGRLARLIAERGYRVKGIDSSVEMIREAKAQKIEGLDLCFAVAGARGEELESNWYDAIVCSSVVEYVRDVKELLTNFSRSLRAEGFLILSYANRRSLWRAYAKWRYGRKAPHFALQHNVWSFEECARALMGAGFELIGSPTFFDSPFDGRRGMQSVGRLALVGTLGLVTARKVEAKN